MTLPLSSVESLRSDPLGIGAEPAPGFSDALGERLLMFDHVTATSVEVLRFKPEFGESIAFRQALQERVAELSLLRHPGIAPVRRVSALAPGERLTLVSKHTAGRRLSDLLDKASGPKFALELIRNVTTAVAALQSAGPGIAHGALTAERLVVGRTGLVLVEHVVGSALQAMHLPASRLRSEFGLVVTDETAPALDARSDVRQIGYLALSLLLERPLDPCRDTDLAALLDEFIGANTTGAPNASRLRRWLERALQLDAPFESAESAHLALADLPDAIEPEIPGTPHVAVAAVAPVLEAPPEPEPAQEHTDMDTSVSGADVHRQPAAARPARSKRRTALLPVTVVLAIVSVAEGVVIAGLAGTRPTPMVVELRSPVVMPAAPTARPVPPMDAPAGAAPGNTPLAEPAAGAPADQPAPAVGRVGGIKVSSPIDLRVIEKDTVLGSTAGPIALAGGVHELDLVNDELGFTVHQSVTVTAGQMTPITVAVPNGRLSINAVPWADVWIDGNPAGQTPLANLSIPIGRHDILLKHPQFGEQHQTAVVKVEGQTRVSATFKK